MCTYILTGWCKLTLTWIGYPSSFTCWFFFIFSDIVDWLLHVSTFELGFLLQVVVPGVSSGDLLRLHRCRIPAHNTIQVYNSPHVVLLQSIPHRIPVPTTVSRPLIFYISRNGLFGCILSPLQLILWRHWVYAASSTTRAHNHHSQLKPRNWNLASLCWFSLVFRTFKRAFCIDSQQL